MLLVDGYQAGLFDTLWPITLVALLTVLFILFKNQIQGSLLRKAIPFLLLSLILIFEYSLIWNILTVFSKPLSDTANGLPLHLCSISAVLVMLYLIFRKKILLEILFYQGMVGALVTFIFPSTSSYPFSFEYIRFFLSHAILYLTPIFFYIIEDFRPTKRTLKIALITTHLWAIIAIAVNLIFETHYMYILPNNAENLYSFIPLHELLPFMANWPMVILFGEALVFPVYFGVYFIFKFINKKSAIQ